MDKNLISEILNNIGILLELKGENPFKIRAYYNASQVISNTSEDIEKLSSENRLTDLKGIGKGISKIIEEIILTGKSEDYEKLKLEIPKELLELLKIQGLGPKRIKTLNNKLGIKTIIELREACEKKKLRNIKGFGAKIEDKILKNISFIENLHNKHIYTEAHNNAEMILNLLRSINGIIKISEAGSLRRQKEVIGDIDIIACSDDKSRPEIVSKFTSNELVESIISSGFTKCNINLKSGIQCDLRIVNEKEYPFALNYFTGSKEHNIQLRSIAKKHGLSLNEYGLTYIDEKNDKKTRKKIPICKNEEDIYDALGLYYIPPELRENTGEIEFAKTRPIPKLIEYKDIRGTLHCHTDHSDGFNSIQQMCETAINLGWEYLGIADHSQAASYAGGMSVNELTNQIKEIDSLNSKLTNFRILKGIECDILPDGSLDFNESILAKLDYVVASIHSKFNMTESEATKRIIKALKNKYVTMLGHPTGRLLLEREGYPVNMKQVIDAASDYGKAIELNCHPKRFDIDWRFIKYAKEKNVIIFINPDAHTLDGLKDVRYGVGIARKGWLEPHNVGNTWSLKKILKYFNEK